MSVPARAASGHERTPEQVARESAVGEVSDVLLNFEHTISRAKKALARVRKNGGDQQVELALTDAIKDLELAHKRLLQDTYYAGDTVRLI